MNPVYICMIIQSNFAIFIDSSAIEKHLTLMYLCKDRENFLSNCDEMTPLNKPYLKILIACF